MKYSPSLPMLQEVVNPHICRIQVETIQVGVFPTSVHRVTLAYNGSHPGPDSVIIKAIAPEWPDDPYGPDREPFFYTELLPHLRLKHPQVHHVGVDQQTNRRVIVMEDMSPRHVFPPPTHRWTNEDARCMLRAYARLHADGLRCLPGGEKREWLMPRYEERFDDERIPAMAADLADRQIWPPLPRLSKLLDRTRRRVKELADYPVSLLHNDIYPPNVGLPSDLADEAVLIDWGMLSWGFAELDLAYVFLQPFRAGQDIDRRSALAYYWAQREAMEGRRFPLNQQLEIQRVADAVLALALVPVAHQRAVSPFPHGSPAAAYWESMFAILAERLAELCHDL